MSRGRDRGRSRGRGRGGRRSRSWIRRMGHKHIKVPTPDSCGECFTLNYYSSLTQEHIHYLLYKTGKNPR